MRSLCPRIEIVNPGRITHMTVFGDKLNDIYDVSYNDNGNNNEVRRMEHNFMLNVFASNRRIGSSPFFDVE